VSLKCAKKSAVLARVHGTGGTAGLQQASSAHRSSSTKMDGSEMVKYLSTNEICSPMLKSFV